MGTKDKTEKVLEDYNDVFADIVNVLIFKGKMMVEPQELRTTGVKSQYKADDSSLHEQERDNAKEWRKGNIAFCMFGIENQTKYEKYMPLRVFGYEGASYRSQILGGPPYNVHQVVTIILNFGNKRWRESSKYLKNVVSIMPELEPYTNNIKLNVFDIAWLDEKVVEMFQSDFRIVADFFVQTRKKKSYKPSEKKMKHVDEVLKLLSIFAGSKEYEELVKTGATKGVKTMCDATKRVKEMGIQQGIQQEIFLSVQEQDYSIERGAEKLGISVSEFEKQMKLAGYVIPAMV